MASAPCGGRNNPSSTLKIMDLNLLTTKFVNISAKVVSVSDLSSTINGGRRFFVFVIGDNSGRMQVVAWQERIQLYEVIEVDQTIEIIGGQVSSVRKKEYNADSQYQIEVGAKSKIKVIDNRGKEHIIGDEPVNQMPVARPTQPMSHISNPPNEKFGNGGSNAIKVSDVKPAKCKCIQLEVQSVLRYGSSESGRAWLHFLGADDTGNIIVAVLEPHSIGLEKRLKAGDWLRLKNVSVKSVNKFYSSFSDHEYEMTVDSGAFLQILRKGIDHSKVSIVADAPKVLKHVVIPHEVLPGFGNDFDISATLLRTKIIRSFKQLADDLSPYLISFRGVVVKTEKIDGNGYDVMVLDTNDMKATVTSYEGQTLSALEIGQIVEFEGIYVEKFARNPVLYVLPNFSKIKVLE